MPRISILGFPEACIGCATFLFYIDSDYAAASMMCFGFFSALMNMATRVQLLKDKKD